MTRKIKRRSLRCGGRPKADFGSIFTSVIAPALSAAGSIADESIDNNKTATNGVVNNNTTIPSDPTKTPTMRLGGRKKCWIGAAIGAATSIAGSLFGASAQKREMRRQKSIRDWQNTTQEAANMTTALNNSQDYQEDYLRQFRTAARLGKTLGAKGIYITDGGDATKIGNNTYLLRGGSHEDVNETGQTGIGINVGGNEVEAEGGEVAQKKNGALRIFSAQPILGGISPAQAVINGANKDKVFSQQQAFKKRNGLEDDGSKAKHGTEVPYKRIHINEDGTFTDTLTGKVYNTSATNGEDVVITGKANHWKEAGKKNTSSYFDPMGAVNFVTAAGAPILNANPSNIVGSIRDSKNVSDFLKHYMMQDTGGFVNTKWAKEHPYLSLGINTIGDIGLGIGTNKAVDILRHPMNYGKYGYKLNKLYKKAGLLNRGEYKTAQENYEKLLDYYIGKRPYDEGALDYTYDVKASRNAEHVNPDIFYSYVTPSKGERVKFSRAYRKKATDNVFTEMTTPIHYGFKKGDDIKAYEDLMNHNPEYYKFLEETNLPWNEQSTVDAFLKRQQTSLRGVYASNYDSDVRVRNYLTQIQAKRKGGDRLNTDGGLYTSNSTGIANAFKNPTDGVFEGYIGKLHYDFGIDKTKPIAEQLRKARSRIVRGGNNNVFAGSKYYNESIKNARKKGAIAIEDKYGRSNGDVLNVTERAYLPGSAKQQNITLQDLQKYSAQENQRGRWNTQGVTKETGDDELFIPKEYNRFDDFINEARIFMKPRRLYDTNKSDKFFNELYSKNINRSEYRNKLIDMSRHLLRRNERYSDKFDVRKEIPIIDFDEPFRFGGRCKLRNGGLTSKDRGSSKHPYPSVSSKDFASGGRSYPIPTKADAVDALRLAGLHGRSDVISKVYSKYPSLRPKAAFGDWVRASRDDNALANLLYESGLFDRESWNTMLRDIHDFTGMGGNPYDTDENVDAVMAPAFGTSSTRVLSQLAKSPEASYTLKQVLGLPTKEMVRKRIAGDIAKRIGVARAARQSSNFRNYNIARMQAANAEVSFSPFANQVRYAEGKPILVNTNGYYTTAGNTISRNAKNMTSGANPFLYAPRTSDEVLEGLSRVISNAKQGAKNVGQKVGNKFKGTPGQKLSDAYYDLTPMQRAKLKGLTLAATLSIPAAYFVESQNGRNKKVAPAQKDAHGKPISRYIARPQEPVKRLTGQASTNIVRKAPVQQPSRPQTKKVTPTQKSVVVPKQVNKTVPQYKGNTTKGNYQLHDGETRTINGIKYTRRGNAIINHKTNVAYIYNKNGNYTGQADYSKVGNFNQAFDAARAAGRSQFIYRADKYNNYSTIKETNAKKERLNRIVGARRVAKALGGCSRPVKGMRPKAGTGMYIPFNKRYTSIYDAPDYDYDYNGGNVLGNNEVTVTAKRIKPTFMKPNNDAMNLIKVPKEEVPYIPQRHNRSRTIFSGGDYLGLGIDTLAALSTGLVNYNTAGKYVLPDRAPIIQASKLPTTYNVNPEIEEVKRYRDRLTGQTFNNTSSSVAALNRSGAINLDALSNLSKLWATKENEENKMLTEDAKNQQTVAAQNVQNELARQSEIARIKNEATQAKGDALNVGLSGLSQAWTNFWTAGRTSYEDDQSRRAMIASSKDATPTRLMEMDFDLSPDVIAALYRNSKEDRTKRFYLSRLSPKQRQKYGIN